MHLTRKTIRYVGAAAAATMALIYYLIGIGVLYPQATADLRMGLLVFGVLAGSAFLFGALLLFAFDKRWLWIFGVLFQIFVYWGYISVAPTRNPPYEIWGITLRIIQVPLLLCLI